MKTAVLVVLTAIAEIAGCYLVALWLTQRRGAWVLVPAAGWLVDAVRPTAWDLVGSTCSTEWGICAIPFTVQPGTPCSCQAPNGTWVKGVCVR